MFLLERTVAPRVAVGKRLCSWCWLPLFFQLLVGVQTPDLALAESQSPSPSPYKKKNSLTSYQKLPASPSGAHTRCRRREWCSSCWDSQAFDQGLLEPVPFVWQPLVFFWESGPFRLCRNRWTPMLGCSWVMQSSYHPQWLCSNSYRTQDPISIVFPLPFQRVKARLLGFVG